MGQKNIAYILLIKQGMLYLEERSIYVRFNKCLWIWWEVASIEWKSSNLDVDKAWGGHLNFKIVLWLGTIQFYLHVPLMYWYVFW